MAEKTKGKVSVKERGKSDSIIAIIVGIVVIVAVIFGIYKLVNNDGWKDATTVEEVVIKESDSDDVKVEKLQKKIQLLTTDIDKIQSEVNTKLEEMNNLYEEYVAEMNKYQTGAPATTTAQ